MIKRVQVVKSYLPITAQIIAGAIVCLSVMGGVQIYVLPLINKVLGAGLIICLALMFRKGQKIPVEALCYFAFVFWAFIGGMLFAQDINAVWTKSFTLLQMGFFFLSVIVSHSLKSNITVSLYTFYFLGTILAGLTFLGGNTQSLLNAGGNIRLAIAGINPNGLGEVWLFNILACFYLIATTQRRYIKIFASFSIPLCVWLILLTGSRKMFLALIIMAIIWFSLIYIKNFLKMIILLVSLVILVVIFQHIIYRNWVKTPMSIRFNLLQEGDLFSGVEVRKNLYLEGVEIFIANPVTGVGLGNFRIISEHQSVSHSDYIEIFATTGVIGAFFYYPIYFIPWRRLSRLNRVQNREINIEYNLFRVYICTIFFLMSGFSYCGSLTSLYMLGTTSGHSYWLIKKSRGTLIKHRTSRRTINSLGSYGTVS